MNISFEMILYFERQISIQPHFISRNILIKIRNLKLPAKTQMSSPVTFLEICWSKFEISNSLPLRALQPLPTTALSRRALVPRPRSSERQRERQRVPRCRRKAPWVEHWPLWQACEISVRFVRNFLWHTLFRSKFRKRHSCPTPLYFETHFEKCS